MLFRSVTDPNLVNLPPVQTGREALESEGIEYDLFDRVRIEPTDISFKEAIQVAVEGNYEAYVAIGGGSSIDTAKAANLYATYPDDFFAYINAPIGEGKPVPGPVKPLFAIPTTAGTGSETTGVASMDLSDRHVKTGIAHRYLKPDLAIVEAYQIDDLLTATWSDTTSSFTPGRLDWMVFSKDVIAVHRGYVLDTSDLDSNALKANGLLSEDTAELSDHLPLVADIRIKSP